MKFPRQLPRDCVCLSSGQLAAYPLLDPVLEADALGESESSVENGGRGGVPNLGVPSWYKGILLLGGLY